MSLNFKYFILTAVSAKKEIKIKRFGLLTFYITFLSFPKPFLVLFLGGCFEISSEEDHAI